MSRLSRGVYKTLTSRRARRLAAGNILMAISLAIMLVQLSGEIGYWETVYALVWLSAHVAIVAIMLTGLYLVSSELLGLNDDDQDK